MHDTTSSMNALPVLDIPRRSRPAPAAGRPRALAWGDDRFTGLVLAAAALAFCAFAVHDALPLASAARQLAVLLLLQLLPGVMLWRWIRPRDGWLVEDLAFGFACGFALSVPAQVLGGLTGSPLISAGVPVLVAGVLALAPGSRHRILAARWRHTPWWLSVAIAVASVGAAAQLASYFRENRLGWGTGAGRPQVDQTFQLALTGQLRVRGPGDWPMLVGQGLDYHWFAHAWMAQLAAVADVPTPQVVLRFAPAVLIVFVVASIAALTLRLGGSAAAACCAVVVAMLLGYANLWHGTGAGLPIDPLSPTLAPSVPPLLALCAVLVVRQRGGRTVVTATALFVLAIVAAGTKGSATPLVVAGLALATTLAACRQRDLLRALGVDFLLTAVALGLCMKVIFHGSADGLTFDPRAAVEHSWPVAAAGGSSSTLVLLAGGVFLVLWGASKAALGVLVLLSPGSRLGRGDPLVWILLGSVLAGACGPALFVQPGLSQNYFRIQAVPLAAVLSGIGAVTWLRRVGAGRVGNGWVGNGRAGTCRAVAAVLVAAGTAYIAHRVPVELVTLGRHRPVQPYLVVGLAVVVAIAGGLATAAVLQRLGAREVAGGAAAVILLTGGWAAAQPLAHVAHAQPATIREAGAIDQAQVNAASYLGRHAPPDAVVMTNRHCRTPRPVGEVCDSRWFFVSAYSGRRMLVEGWGYSPPITARYTKGRTSITAPFYDPALLRLNDGFYRRPSSDAANRLWHKGVRWMYVDKLTSPAVDFGHLATMQYQNPAASIWKLNPP